MKSFTISELRQHFPILNQKINKHSLVYFDNGATTQKPNCVVDKESEFYRTINANVHRATHYLSSLATVEFEQSRMKVANFINAASCKEIIWTKGTTESINLVAYSWGTENLEADDEIVLSYADHHANIVPWQVVAETTGAKIKVMPLDASGRINEATVNTIITEKTKIVCCPHISNVIGKINPLEIIIARAKVVGAVTLIDGAQAIAHLGVDVQKLDCDFYVFSAHKIYGPSGLGVLYGRQTILNQMKPYQTGGEMIEKVSFSGTTYNELPFKFEAGTPNVAGVVAFSQAIDFIDSYRLNHFSDEKKALNDYCFNQLSVIPEINLIVEEQPDIPLFSFEVNGHHHKDIAVGLDAFGIAVRAGHHCAMPLMEYLNLSGCLRISLAPYNTIEEIDYFIKSLKSLLNDNLHETINKTVSFLHDDELNNVTQNRVEKLSSVKSWDGKHREIMLLGKELKRLPKQLRSEETLITGCESSAWLYSTATSTGHYFFQADSDAKVIRGLLVIVLSVYNHKTAEQIIEFDIEGYFQRLGLLQHLSPSRGNGLLAIVNKIKSSVS